MAFRVFLFVAVTGALAACASPRSTSAVRTSAAPEPPSGGAPTEARLVGGERTAWEGWHAWRLERSAEPDGEVYIHPAPGRAPAIVALQGSGCMPLFDVGASSRASGLILARDVAEIARHAHVVTIEKRGVRSFAGEAFQLRELENELDGCSERFWSEGMRKETRVEDVVALVQALHGEDWVSDVLLLGHSEGTHVATGAARALGPEQVRAVALLSSAQPSQFLSLVTLARQRGDEEAVATAYQAFARVLEGDRDASYSGYPDERWRGFAVRSSPLEDMLAVDVPTFVLHGEADQNTSIVGADAFVIELARQRPQRPIVFWMLPDVDHFVQRAGAEEPFLPAMVRRLLQWSEAPDSGLQVWRGVEGSVVVE